MVDTTTLKQGPNWPALYATAEAQAGHFTTAQAAEAGYSPPLLHKYLAKKRITRIRRGVYRVVHFPSFENEELISFWLWADKAGVFSHQTALALHDLSDILPAQAHMTVPANWQSRRLRIPSGLMLHYNDLEADEHDWLESVPLTSSQRTLYDCIDAHVSPDLVGQAIRQASQRGLISKVVEISVAQRLEDSMRMAE